MGLRNVERMGGTGLINKGTGLTKEGTGLTKEGTGLIKEGTGLIKNGAGVIKNGARVIKNGAGLIKKETGVMRSWTDQERLAMDGTRGKTRGKTWFLPSSRGEPSANIKMKPISLQESPWGLPWVLLRDIIPRNLPWVLPRERSLGFAPGG
eukprot:gene11974-biopygen5355